MSIAPERSATTPLAKGVLELTPMLSFSYQNFTFTSDESSVEAGSLTTLGGTILAGYCFNDRVQAVYGVLVNHQSLSSPGSARQNGTSIGAVAGLQYNFVGLRTAIPFLRVGMGFATNSGNLSLGDQHSWIVPTVDVGMRVLIGSVASVNVATGYQHRTAALGLEGMTSDTFVLELGLSVFTRRVR